MIRKNLVCLCIALVMSSCSLYRVNFEEVTSNVYEEKRPEQVLVLETVTRAHEVIGYITVNTERNKSLQDVLQEMKRDAAKLGGDAITNIQSNATGTWKKVPVQKLIGNAYVRANFTATVIVLLDKSENDTTSSEKNVADETPAANMIEVK